MKRAALYVRVSTEEQKLHGLSIENQEESLKDYCKKNGYTIAGIYNDAGISARKKYKGRPELLRMIRDCQDGLIDIVLFTRLDRWFRSVADYYEVQGLLDDCGVPWRAIWEDYETETSSGVLKVNIMLSVSQAEADRTSERVKSIIRHKVDKGEYVGRVPTGYMVKDKHLVKDPEQEEGVRKTFEAYMDYLPVRECVEVGRRYGLNLYKSKLVKMIGNPVYAGESRIGGGMKCDAYLTDAEWRTVKKRREQYVRTPKKRGLGSIFSGIVRCGACGSAMICKNREKKGKNYAQFKCRMRDDRYTCSAKGISERKLERYLLGAIEQIVEEETARYEINLTVNDSTHEKERKKLEQKLSRIGERYEDGDITREEYVRKRDDVKHQIAAIPLPAAGKPPELPENWRDTYDQLSREGKSKFWHRIIDRVVIHHDRDHEVYLNHGR